MISLPIDEVLPALREALATRHEAVLEAPPGAGKTTRVPLALLNAGSSIEASSAMMAMTTSNSIKVKATFPAPRTATRTPPRA